MNKDTRWLIESALVIASIFLFVQCTGCDYGAIRRPKPKPVEYPDPIKNFAWSYTIRHKANDDLVVVSADPMDHLLDAIWKVESSGQFNPKDGDGGNAVGPFQIWKCVVDDLNANGCKFTYEDRRDYVKSRVMCRLYINLWSSKMKRPATMEDKARIWNGGPKGYTKKATIAYWKRVKAELKGVASR